VFGVEEGIGIGVSGPMTVEHANNIIRVIHKFTKEHSVRVAALVTRLENKSNLSAEAIAQIEQEVGQIIEAWNQKVRKLGGNPKGLWLVDIDAGDGYYCWKYPEPEICYWHEYDSGYTGRMTLSDRAERSQKLYANSPGPDQSLSR
jgi:hypothetical protein